MSESVSWKTLVSAAANGLQFLGDLLELVALDYVAYLIFAEVTQPDSAFQTGTNFFDVILETAER